MREKSATPALEAARIAAKQHGVVSTQQLLDVGLTHDGIRRRHRAGRLYRMHRGIYAVAHSALSDHGRWIAAVLAIAEASHARGIGSIGMKVVLSHRAAAAL
jgi:predicted transcriptional regulator of viral defense system